MANEWFEGQWQVIPEKSMQEKARLKPGEIMKHRNGAVILNCPACNGLQFVNAQVIGSDELPSLSRPVQCGSGHCKRCGIWFRIIDGKTVEESPQKKEVEIPEKLRRAGVKKPLSLTEAIQLIKARG